SLCCEARLSHGRGVVKRDQFSSIVDPIGGFDCRSAFSISLDVDLYPIRNDQSPVIHAGRLFLFCNRKRVLSRCKPHYSDHSVCMVLLHPGDLFSRSRSSEISLALSSESYGLRAQRISIGNLLRTAALRAVDGDGISVRNPGPGTWFLCFPTI